MAKAFVQALKPILARVEHVTLTLTPEEAITLNTIMNKIAGDCHESIRLHADVIGTALNRAGVPSIGFYDYPRGFKPCTEDSNSIYFTVHTKQYLIDKLAAWTERLSK